MTAPQGKFLALDLATNVGWAVCANGVVTHGEHSCKRIHGKKSQPDENPGAAYFKFRNFLTDSIHLHKPDALLTEYTGHFQSAPARDICCGFRGILLEVAARFGLPLYSYAPMTIKKRFCGTGKADKPMMMAEAKRLGYDVAGPDETDAIAILYTHFAAITN